MRASLIFGIVITLTTSLVRGQTQASSDDAAALYRQAAQILRADDAKNIMSPAASNLTYPEYPPMPAAWLQMEKQDYDAHAQVRELVHQAASLNHAAWPISVPPNIPYLNNARNVANEIADAALYQSLILKDQPAAFSSARDLLHFADLLKSEPNENVVRLLVAAGLEAMDMSRLMVMQANATITSDPRDTHDLQLSSAKQWIARLLDHPDAQAQIKQAMKGEEALAKARAATNPAATVVLMPKSSSDRLLETMRRVLTERDFTAMALAAHVYRHEHGRWPANLDELASELPRIPVDPWVNGKQTLGYVLIKGGLPDAGNRPLVYSRNRSKDGLFFKTDEPDYTYYNFADVKPPPEKRKEGGQFRDVAAWVPAAAKKAGPTTEPLPN